MDSIIQVVANAAEENAPYAWKSDVTRDGAHLWLRSDQFESSRKFVGERVRRFCTVLTPPSSSFFDVP